MKRENTAVSAAAGVLGRMKSPKKAAAVRRNGRLGGAPPKYRPGQIVMMIAGAPVGIVGRFGRIEAYLGPTRYRVSLDGQHYELRSWWVRGHA